MKYWVPLFSLLPTRTQDKQHLSAWCQTPCQELLLDINSWADVGTVLAKVLSYLSRTTLVHNDRLWHKPLLLALVTSCNLVLVKKHQAGYTANVPDYTTLHVQLSAPDQMFTLSMLKPGIRNNCTTMHVNHTEDLKHASVFCLCTRSQLQARPGLWHMLMATQQQNSFIFTYLGLYRQNSDLIRIDSAMNCRAFSYDT